MTDTKTEILAIIEHSQKRADAATEGPWEHAHASVWGFCPLVTNRTTRTELIVGQSSHDYDREFVASARTDVPRLNEALRIAVEVLDMELEPLLFRKCAGQILAALKGES